jgi:hypothetical protein
MTFTLYFFFNIYSSVQDSVVRMVGNHLIIPGGTRTIDATGKMRSNSTLYRLRLSRLRCPLLAIMHSPGYHALVWLSCIRLAIMHLQGYHVLA